MMNKFIFVIFCLPLLLSAQDATIHVVDRDGVPVEDAEVTVFYERVGKLDSSQTRVGKTDKDGTFKCSGEAELCIFFTVSKEGYYDYGKIPAKKDELCGRPEKIEKTIQISKVIKPIPLYARNIKVSKYGSNYIKIPEKEKWCSYDLKIGDWVSPYGRGKVSDVVFRYENEFMGFDMRDSQKTLEELKEFSKKAFAARGEKWTEEKFRLRSGDWNATLEIAFPNEKEGLVKVVDEFLPHSALHMPHEAPKEGYISEREYSVKTYEQSTSRDDIGFFLRTRVVLDEDGEIESANYSKIHGDFRFLAGGMVSFTYYFNPVLNDRNLEFDPEQNLFPEGTPGTFNFILP